MDKSENTHLYKGLLAKLPNQLMKSIGIEGSYLGYCEK